MSIREDEYDLVFVIVIRMRVWGSIWVGDGIGLCLDDLEEALGGFGFFFFMLLLLIDTKKILI